MCETFTFYHICGHVQTSKTSRCGHEIQRQVTRLEDDISSPTGQPWECTGEISPESYLNPTPCENCKKLGMIGDWLDSDPKLRYEIVKEWQRKRQAAIPQISENISDSTQFGLDDDEFSPSTTKRRPSDTSTGDDIVALEALSSVLEVYASEASQSEQQTELMCSKIAKKSETMENDTRQAEDLKMRMSTVRKRMERLIASVKDVSSTADFRSATPNSV